ncbi:hypothetical protein BH10ACT6_BH10ACT6_07510 [soil metagenome]
MSTREGRAPHGLFDDARRRRLLVALVAVPAILVGLLAMHFLAGADEVRPSTMAMSAGIENSAVTLTADPSDADCGFACVTSSNMTMSMACVLALLVTIVVLTVRTSFTHRDPELTQRLVSLWRARIASLPPPVPPSLHVLSISRI